MEGSNSILSLFTCFKSAAQYIQKLIGVTMVDRKNQRLDTVVNRKLWNVRRLWESSFNFEKINNHETQQLCNVNRPMLQVSGTTICFVTIKYILHISLMSSSYPIVFWLSLCVKKSCNWIKHFLKNISNIGFK